MTLNIMIIKCIIFDQIFLALISISIKEKKVKS